MNTIKRPVLERFVDGYPDKAVDILLKACHDDDIKKELVDFLLDPGQPPKSKPHNGPEPTIASTAHAIPNPRSSAISQRTSSFSKDHRRHSSRNYAGVGQHTEPPSPPRTRSNHSKSLAGKDGRENILILATNEDDDIETHLATMKPAPIEHSVIGEHMFLVGRICESNIEDIDEELISIPRRGVPGTLIQVAVSSRAELTWKRSTSNASHKTMFYLMPQEFLDIDLLLGSPDSGEETMPSPPQKGQGTIFKEHARSHHRSSNANEGTNNSPRSYPDELVETFIKNQHEQRAAQSRLAPIATSNQRPGSSRASRPATIDPTSSIETADQIPSSDTIRVRCALGRSTLKFWLDLDASAQAFLHTIQDEFDAINKSFDRKKTSIVFHCEKQISDEDGGEKLSLNENALEADWEGTIDWIRDNRRETAPQMYATVQFKEG